VFNPAAVQPPRPTSKPDATAVQPGRTTSVERARPSETNNTHSRSAGGGPARERAHATARYHFAQHGQLPTVTELMRAAQVARGTAGVVLKSLRVDRPALHLVNAQLDQDTDS
jgi:hypothetical protein